MDDSTEIGDIARRTFVCRIGLGAVLASQRSIVRADTAAPSTQVPSEFQGPLASLRSPLLFNEGSIVKTPEDWQRRRDEILAEWHRIMGVWPAIVDRPKIEVLETTIREDITQRRVRVQIALDQSCEGYVLVPRGQGPFPAVFVPFYDPETSVGLGKSPLRDFAWQLAQRGFVALAIGSPGGDARKPLLSQQAKCQPLSYLGYIAANAWNAIAAMPEVDAKRIGIVGHSYGGKWAMFGSCLWDKYACAVWSDPGVVFDETRESINYQEPWYLGFDPAITRKPGLVRDESPRTGAYKVLVETGHDLHELHALMAPRPFLVSGGAEDPPKRWAALNHTIAINRLLGFEGRVSMNNREKHSPTEESNEQVYRFLKYWLD